MATETTTVNVQDDEVSLLDLVLVMAKHKKMIIGLPIIAALVATAVSLTLPNDYTATFKIAPSKMCRCITGY